MTARNEELNAERAVRLKTTGLSVLLAFVAACFIANDVLAAKTFSGPPGWRPVHLIAVNLLMVGAIWGSLWLRPSRVKTAVQLALLAIVAFMGFRAAIGIVKVLVAAGQLWGPWAWQTGFMLASNLLIGVCTIWALLWLKPWQGWKGSDEPVSPSTRKTNKLLGLSGVIAVAGALVLIYGTIGKENPFGLFSNGPVPQGIAVFAIACWLLSMLINKWYWYFSADEHERKADDVGNLAGWALFMVVTPAWWVAARAGLVPRPDAMVLWIVASCVSSSGYFWRRNR